MTTIAQFLRLSVPPEQSDTFAQDLQLHNANKLYILSFVNIAVYLLLYILDFARYQHGELLSSPIGRAIFYWHLFTTLSQIPYLLLIRHIKAIRENTFPHTTLLLNIYVWVFAMNLTVRGILGVLDRGSLVFFVVLVFLIGLLLVLPTLQRTLLVALPAGCMLFFITMVHYFNHDHSSSPHLLIFYFEVVLSALVAFILATMQYGNFISRFCDKQAIAEKNRALQIQQDKLSVKNNDLETLNQEHQRLNTQLISQQKELISQQRELNTQAELLASEHEKLLAQTATQNRQLTTFTLQMADRNRVLQELETQLTDWQTTLPKQYKTEANRLIRFVQHNKDMGEEWERFKLFFEQTHPQFFTHLQQNYPELNKHDYRLLALLSLQLSTKDIAMLLGISTTSVNMARYRLRQRLKLAADTDLSTFAMSLMLE
jgi:DNA-binding CsgD family transcriptional regulator/tellurite resistance protein